MFKSQGSLKFMIMIVKKYGSSEGFDRLHGFYVVQESSLILKSIKFDFLFHLDCQYSFFKFHDSSSTQLVNFYCKSTLNSFYFILFWCYFLLFCTLFTFTVKNKIVIKHLFILHSWILSILFQIYFLKDRHIFVI